LAARAASSSFFMAGIVSRQRGRFPQFWFMKSSMSSAVVLGSTVTGFSVGAAGALVPAHSSTMLFAWAGSVSAAIITAAAIRLRFMNILPRCPVFERALVGRIMRKQCVLVKAAAPHPAC